MVLRIVSLVEVHASTTYSGVIVDSLEEDVVIGLPE